MKIKLYAFLVIFFATTIQSRAQYKDLEGVFFGKVIALGVGGSVISYKDKLLGTNMTVTPLNYSVLLSNKFILSMKLSLHKEVDAVYNGNDGINNYTKTVNVKFFEYEAGLKFALTSEGLEKPTSVFLSLQGGNLLGKRNVIDSRWGSSEEMRGGTFLGAGLAVFQRLGDRFVITAEPAYRLDVTPKIYLDDNGSRKLSFSHLNAHVGIMYLIGRKN